ncbi:MAG: TonB-dependent receptor [Acidobacteriia bacterium]|nr:TonB-dependent receptor [Terriglobia bacterium]
MLRLYTTALQTCFGLALFGALLLAQAPSGTIAGTVTDETGSVVPNATVTITDKSSGAIRHATSNAEGIFLAPVLLSGTYTVKVDAAGFRAMLREASVQAGTTTTVNAQLQVGAAAEVVSVEAATNQLRYESHNLDGVISRKQIESLPLNGRSFLQLAFLEPGVSVSAQRLSQYNAQFSVSILGGSSAQTAITVDGGNVRNSIEGNTGMNFSQEIVEEFQISSVNFDLATGITGTGSVNVVTRSGGNDYHGAGYFFFRDHNMSAYPALERNSFNPDPFFARRQSGVWLGGPIQKDKLFFFANIEHNNQDAVVTIQPNAPAFASLAQNASQPYTGSQMSVRFDYRVNANHNLFMRYSHDGNKGFGPLGNNQLPSNWVKNTNWSDQSILGATSSFSSSLVNDFRFAYQYWRNRNLFPDETDCPGCIGLGLPQMSIQGSNVVLGNTSNATQGRDLRKFAFTDNVTWQRGTHRVRFGGEIERGPGTGFWGYADPAAGVLYGPDFLRQIGAGALIPALGIPAQITSNADLMRLPLAGFSMGIGDPSQPPPFQVEKARTNDRIRLFIQDSWRLKPRFTLNFGLAWNYESTLVNHDLDKPQILAPILGADGLAPSARDFNNFSPSVGFAWNVGSDNKTVIRGGAGIYYNTRLLWQRLQERSIIGPAGNGRVLISSTAIQNTIPGIPNFPLGAPLDFSRGPTLYTFGHMMSILPGVRAAAEASLKPNPAIRAIEVSKVGADIIPYSYPAPYSEHFNIGVQRELRRNLVLNADFVFRQFMKDEIGTLDYNRYQAVTSQGASRRVLPVCTAAQRVDPKAICSLGAITVRTPAGRSNYKALLVKVDKRFSERFMFTASYALQSENGLNGIRNLDNWFSSWGPTGSNHNLNISGLVDLPGKVQVSFISSIGTKGPVMPTIPTIDLDGDGTSGEPLPGASFKEPFNRGLGKDDLTRLINEFNSKYAGTTTSRNQRVPTLNQPSDYEFGEHFFSQDFRVSRPINFGERVKLNVFAEVFNAFNIANRGGYSFDLANTAAFGKPTNRAGQIFGSGGPRAFQLGARLSF